jgi:hypothetical protein
MMQRSYRQGDLRYSRDLALFAEEYRLLVTFGPEYPDVAIRARRTAPVNGER